MGERISDCMTPAQQMNYLLCRLQRMVGGRTFSYRLEEIRAIVVELVECWAMYQRGERQPVPRDHAEREGLETGGAYSSRAGSDDQ
jgi:hypothetical protein